MTEYRLSRLAERDVVDIYHYTVDRFGEHQADRYTDGLTARFVELAQNPAFGRDYSHISAGVRRVEHISHSIYYRPAGGGILILRVLHKRMDPARWL